MAKAYVTLYTGWGGLQQLATTGHCIAKFQSQPKWDYEISVPLSATNIEWDGGEEEPLETVKVDLNK